MESSEGSQIVEDEINGNWSVSNAHGVDLKRCLVIPTRRDYVDPIAEGQSLSLWLVLEEVPEDQSGYKIVFDEATNQFGLATGDTERNRDVRWVLWNVLGNACVYVMLDVCFIVSEPAHKTRLPKLLGANSPGQW